MTRREGQAAAAPMTLDYRPPGSAQDRAHAAALALPGLHAALQRLQDAVEAPLVLRVSASRMRELVPPEWLASDPPAAGVLAAPLLDAFGTTLGTLEVTPTVGGPVPAPDVLEACAASLALALGAEARAREAAIDTQQRDDLLRVLAHDLRSPLNAITGWCHMLQSGALSAEQQAKAADVITRNARLQGDMIGDVADFARILAGRMPFSPSAIDVAPALHSALAAIRPAAESKSITVEADIPPSLPLAFAEGERVTQVVRLLLAHAIRFTSAGERVRVSARGLPEGVAVVVEDAGGAMLPEVLPFAFQRFVYRDGVGGRRPDALRLGLAYRLVTAFGGHIVAENVPDESGLAVTATFPPPPPAHSTKPV